jgi:3-dehydroquinate dehydratase-1
MAAQNPVKTRQTHRCEMVGVIATRADLQLALEMAHPPDFFELRLDHLSGQEEELEKKIPLLRAPLIVTARHPAEGGANNLPRARRQELISRFLPHARYIDLELRSVDAFQSLLNLPAAKKVRRIISFHDFGSTPSSRSLHAKARAAKSYGAAIFKTATRTDTPAQLARLFEFVANRDPDLALSVMGVGHLGAVSRLALALCGSVLVYGSLAESRVEGQLSVEQLRAAFDIFQIH